MADAVETMAYTGALPWHGLGNAVSPDLTPDEMADAAGINWEVKALPVKALNPETKKYSLPVEGFNIITRMSDHKTLGPCGPAWKPVQNTAALDFFNKFTQAGHMSMETAGSLDGGKHVWGLAKINKDIVLPGNDVVSGHLLLSNPHIWGKSMTIMFTPIRVVCMNTLMMAMNSGGQRFRHPHSVVWGPEQAEKAEEALGLGMLLTERFEENASKLAETIVDDNVIDLFLAKQMSPKSVTNLNLKKRTADVDSGALGRNFHIVRDLVKTQPGANLTSSEGTLWGAFNAVTYFYDHEYGKTADTRMTSAWFGANKINKMRAWEDALEFADALAA
jgi:phage/plasmid-like protein (TIGR03299 family)